MWSSTKFNLRFIIIFLHEDVCRCKDGIETAAATGSVNSLGGNERGVHRLAIIVPFRDRFEELQEFVPHIHRFLSNQGVLHDIFIVNQVSYSCSFFICWY